ncbi:UDP-N-acetylmuramate dehydrogenase [Leucothrix arctica]|uniref:UDP-N-acetylenolpyruvoylglucosamine reductase n=1 Tax=Leucothrix arctica TaxID=1481894 RepID=A0A317CMJ6_9GAMM|nr:UDP-N-acetylmuramate dehydrogenase [Leucothrix arctica]PWQ99441.1 UDP-N-acetylenolpyruvoylglucosamine reductase [Leucothrix arctica]
MQIQKNYPLKALNSFGVSISADLFTKLVSTSDVDQLIQWRKDNPDTSCLLIGGGSNMLFRDDFSGLAVSVALSGRALTSEDDDAYYISAAAGENWHEFVRWTIDQGYAGLENLSLIPGTVGAAPMQNIGAYGVELGDRLERLSAVDLITGERRVFSNEDCEFAYRDSFFKRQPADSWLIESVTFRLAKQPEWVVAYAGVDAALDGQEPSARLISDVIIALRQSKLPDPKVIGNAGSFFKNPIMGTAEWEALKVLFPNLPGYPQKDGSDTVKTSAGWLIDQCEWKAFRDKDAGIYEKHALVLVNHGEASGAEIWALAERVIGSVSSKFGIVLEAEPRVIA